ncbi:MAG: hypothetical protein Q618_VCMC00003G0169 [Varibaculum cambriense DORA_20]|uniref:hypothetical protein n=1 Tax=Varibaculum cambriense TaxID=184870 RepID=UPI0003D59632|nr:hypothetical protein [Varibaculum cambriense]ETI81867.1 MAG: hypothetical protein Q618_VCMC00003G0169 [Varibaculum cambriense DORA_20]
MLSAILLSTALAAGGCGGADYDMAFTDQGVKSTVTDFTRDGGAYIARVPILEGGTIAPGIEEKKTFQVCNRTGKKIRLKATQKSILNGGTDDFFKDLTVNGTPVRDMTSPLPLKDIDGAELKALDAVTTPLDYKFDFEAVSGNRANAGRQKAVVEIRIEAEEIAQPAPPEKPAPPAPRQLAITGAGVIGAIIIAGAGIVSGGALRRRVND